MVITLGIILLFSCLREGYEDYKRYQSDRQANSRKKLVYYPGKDSKSFIRVSSRHLKVGDFIKIQADEEVPADVIMLKSSNRNGIAFVNTVNLDGESNLKDKKSPSVTQHMHELTVGNIRGLIKCDKPNYILDYFDGCMYIDHGESSPLVESGLQTIAFE